jgi:Ribosomal protein L12E/L44/L45/RPP1/RPP2
MQEAAAYLLLILGGNTSPSADDVKNVIAACGAEANEDAIASLVGDLEGKSINELFEEGMSKLKDVPMGGGGGGGGAAAGAAAGGDAAAEEVVEEEEEEADIGGGVDMFGSGGDGGDY